MHAPLLLSALLLGQAYALPYAQQPGQPQPAPQSPDILPPALLQSKVHEKLTKPKEWYNEVSEELVNEGLRPAPETGEPAKELDTETIVEKMNWSSDSSDNFRDFLTVLKQKQYENRQTEAMAPEPPAPGGQTVDPRYTGTREYQAPARLSGQGQVNWVKRSVIPKKTKKEPIPAISEKAIEEKSVTDPTPEEEEVVTDVNEVEITNEDFDEMFSFYAEKHDNRGFGDLQGYLDSMLVSGKQDWKSKIWQPEPQPQPQASQPGVYRRDHSSHRYASTPENLVAEHDRKPISINPEVFNRIAADYQFDQNPTSINNEDSYFGRFNTPKSPSNGFNPPTTSQGKQGSSSLKNLNKRFYRAPVPCPVVLMKGSEKGELACYEAEGNFRNMKDLDIEKELNSQVKFEENIGSLDQAGRTADRVGFFGLDPKIEELTFFGRGENGEPVRFSRHPGDRRFHRVDGFVGY